MTSADPRRPARLLLALAALAGGVACGSGSKGPTGTNGTNGTNGTLPQRHGAQRERHRLRGRLLPQQALRQRQGLHARDPTCAGGGRPPARHRQHRPAGLLLAGERPRPHQAPEGGGTLAECIGYLDGSDAVGPAGERRRGAGERAGGHRAHPAHRRRPSCPGRVPCANARRDAGRTPASTASSGSPTGRRTAAPAAPPAPATACTTPAATRAAPGPPGRCRQPAPEPRGGAARSTTTAWSSGCRRWRPSGRPRPRGRSLLGIGTREQQRAPGRRHPDPARLQRRVQDHRLRRRQARPSPTPARTACSSRRRPRPGSTTCAAYADWFCPDLGGVALRHQRRRSAALPAAPSPSRSAASRPS